MANVGTLSIKFTGDAKQLEDTFTRVGVKANVFANAISSGISSAAGVAKDFIAQAVQMASTNENTLTSFQNLTGSVGEAKKLYKDLLDFAARTPFSTQQINSGATSLLGFGLSTQEATQAIKDLGAAAAANADTDLKRLVVTFGQIQGANRATVTDLREFVNNGIPIYQLLADTLDVSVSKINEMASSGQITGDVITRVFNEAAQAGGRFGTTLETQSQTLAGLTSTLKDNYAITLGKLGDAILPTLKRAIEAANTALLQFQEYIDGGKLNPFIAGLGAVIQNIGIFGKAARDAIGPVIGLYKASDAVYQVMKGNFSQAWEQAKEAAVEFTKPLNTLLSLGENVRKVTQDYNTELGLLNVATAAAGDFMEDYNTSLEKTKTSTEGNTKATGELKKALQDVNAELNEIIRQEAARQVTGEVQSAGVPTKFKDLGVSPTGPPLDTTGTLSPVAEIDAQALAKERLAAAEQKLANNMSLSLQVASTYGQKLQESYAKGEKGVKAFASAAVASAREVIAAEIRTAVVAAASKALQSVPFPFNIVLAGIAGGAAEALFRSLISKIGIPAFGDGGVVYGPTLALIGEKGPEAIVPLRGGRGAGTRSEVYIAGVQYGADTYWQNANVNMLGRQIYGS